MLLIFSLLYIEVSEGQICNIEPHFGIATVDGKFFSENGEEAPRRVTLTESIFLDTLTVRVSPHGTFSIVMPLCRSVPCRLTWDGGSLWVILSPNEATVCTDLPCHLDSICLPSECISLDNRLRQLLDDSVYSYTEKLNYMLPLMSDNCIMLCPAYANLCQWLLKQHIIAPQRIAEELKVRWLKQQMWQHFTPLDEEQLNSMISLPQPYKDYLEIHRMHMLKRQRIAEGDSIVNTCLCGERMSNK